VPRVRPIALIALASFSISCHSGAPTAIDAKLFAYVPAGANILAGVNLQRLRASPLYPQLPPAAAVFLAPLGNAESLLVASHGSEYLALSRGAFRQAPAGAVLLHPGIAGAGSPAWLRNAAARSGGSSPLLERAKAVADASEIWMVADGAATLPVTGNAANLNRLLHSTQYATLSVRLTSNISIDVEGMCGTADSARQLEGTLRAFLSLGAAAEGHQQAVAGLLKRIRISRDDRAVHMTLTVDAGELAQFLKLFTS
jgi:hypothetical protein